MKRIKLLLAFAAICSLALATRLYAGPCYNLVMGACSDQAPQTTCHLKCALGEWNDPCGTRIGAPYTVEVCAIDPYSEFSRCSKLVATEPCQKSYTCVTSYEPCEEYPGQFWCYQNSPTVYNIYHNAVGLDERFQKECPVLP